MQGSNPKLSMGLVCWVYCLGILLGPDPTSGMGCWADILSTPPRTASPCTSCMVSIGAARISGCPDHHMWGWYARILHSGSRNNSSSPLMMSLLMLSAWSTSPSSMVVSTAGSAEPLVGRRPVAHCSASPHGESLAGGAPTGARIAGPCRARQPAQ